MNSNGIKGGQGRSAQEVEQASRSLFALVVVAVVTLIVWGAVSV